MKKERYEIKSVDSWPGEEIVRLYRVGGWWADTDDSSGIPLLIRGSYLFAVVIDHETEQAIGMGRVLSDGVSDAYIQDFVILPEHRRCGVGKRLLEFLVTNCLSKGITWIGLLAEPGSDPFYLSSGFSALKGYTPMKYHRGK